MFDAIGAVVVLVVAGWRDDFVDHGQPRRPRRRTRVTATDSTGATGGRPLSTITVNPALACSVSPAAQTIDSGQSVTISDDVLRWYCADHVRVDAGWRDDFVDHGHPDHDDDVLGDGDRRDRRDEDVDVGDHGEPAARPARLLPTKTTIDSGQSTTVSATCTGGTRR